MRDVAGAGDTHSMEYRSFGASSLHHALSSRSSASWMICSSQVNDSSLSSARSMPGIAQMLRDFVVVAHDVRGLDRAQGDAPMAWVLRRHPTNR